MAKVLLVEDDNNLREIYQARLTAEGYDIVAAQNGEEALVSAKQNKPDLIISDVMMPRISGFEMLDILRNTDELKHTKVIMLTALGQAEDQARADNLGADKYLVKSQVTLEDIVNAAKELLGEDVSSIPASAPAPETPTTIEPAAVLPAPAPDSTPSSNEPAVVPASDVSQPDTTVVVPPAPANPEPPTVISIPVPPEPISEPVVSVAAPAPDATLVSEPVEAAPLVPEPTDLVVPASDVSQPDTTVVVPPAPANPEPPIVTAIPMPPEPAAVPDTTPAAEASVAEAAPQSIEAEEAALKAQIEGFATQSADTPQETAPPTAQDDSQTESNDEALASAVQQLNGGAEPADEPESAIVTPTPPEDVAEELTPDASSNTLGDSATVAHKKVIQPISNNLSSGSSLDELLAKEEAQQAAPLANPVTNGVAGQAPAVHPAATPGQSFDPNSISL